MKIRNSDQILLILKILLGICFAITLLFITYSELNNAKKEEVDFDGLYAKVEEILNQEPQKTNSYKDDMIFYKPKGYKFVDESYIISKNEMYIEIIPEKIEMNSELYSINEQKELVFEKQSTDKDDISMFIWQNAERYDALILKKDGYATAGNFSKKDLEQGLIDMANILNTLKVKEIK